MLLSIHIRNYALIDSLDIDFNPGFSVITGETGAGKSILLGAIGLLLGQRADSKSICEGADKCVIEGRFDVSTYQLQSFFEAQDLEYDEQECILRRELQSNGKSRAFINDTPASLAQMKELGSMLIDIHSQHQNLLLGTESFQLRVVDILAKDEKVVADFGQAFTSYKESCRELNELKQEAEKAKDDEEYLRFQCQQLEEAKLQEGEQEELEHEAEELEHAEEIKAVFFKVNQTLDNDENSLLQTLKEDVRSLEELGKVYPAAQEFSQRMESCFVELKELNRELEGKQEKMDFNPARLEEVNDRLNFIYSMQQKHRVQTLSELLDVMNNFRARLDEVSSYADRIEIFDKRVKESYGKVVALASDLTALRKSAAQTVECELENRLVPLGMPNIQFKVEITPKEQFDATGGDNVTFWFSANKNTRLQPISEVASGGEIARVMLAVKAMIAGAVKLPTIIFDEIDTGISGGIAERMAHIMRDMGKQHRQVISITHLPQIAAVGDTHYKVYKKDTENSTHTYISCLDETERVTEIARLMSGAELTKAALENAKELMKNSK